MIIGKENRGIDGMPGGKLGNDGRLNGTFMPMSIDRLMVGNVNVGNEGKDGKSGRAGIEKGSPGMPMSIDRLIVGRLNDGMAGSPGGKSGSCGKGKLHPAIMR